MTIFVVATDFLKSAYCALFHAAKLFKEVPSHFIILNSFKTQVSLNTSIIDLDISQINMDQLFHESIAAFLAVKHKLITDLEPT